MRKGNAACVVLAWLLAASGASASAAPAGRPDGAPAADPSAMQLDRIVVTARRRDESPLDAETGDTGLELVAGASRQARLTGAVGARYTRTWSPGRHMLQLDLDARYRRDVLDGEPLRAAFRGVPEAGFDVPVPAGAGAGEWHAGLVGAWGRHTQWSVDYAGSIGGDRPDTAWRVGLRHGF